MAASEQLIVITCKYSIHWHIDVSLGRAMAGIQKVLQNLTWKKSYTKSSLNLNVIQKFFLSFSKSELK